MVTVTNGVKSFRIPAGAVEVYKNMGFREVLDSKLDLSDEGTTTSVSRSRGGSKEDDFVEELLEKPLSQWSNEEIKDFVKIKGIDTSGVQKVSQVRDIIKNYLEEEQKRNG